MELMRKRKSSKRSSKSTLDGTSKKLVIVAVCCLVVLFLWFLIVNQYENSQFYQAQSVHAQLISTQKINQKKIIQLREMASKMPELRQLLAKMMTKLPKRFEVEKILRKITLVASEQNLHSVFFEPQKVIPGSFYQVIPIKMAVTGSFKQIAGFAAKLAQLPVLVILQDFALERAQKASQTLTMHLVFNVFVQGLQAPAKPLERFFQPRFDYLNYRNPFLSPAETVKTSSTAIAGRYSVTSLKLIGLLIAGEDKIAYLTTKEGEIYTVREGDHVGFEDALVKKITRHSVDLIEKSSGKSNVITLILIEPQ